MGTGTSNDKPELLLAKALDHLFRGVRPAVAQVADGTKTRKTCLQLASVAEMKAAGAAFLHAQPAAVSVFTMDDPTNPFAPYLRGEAGTPNHQAEGLAVELLDSFAAGGNAPRYPTAKARALLFLEWQSRYAMMSVPRAAGGPISEFNGPSHPQWWINAFAAILWHAQKVSDAELLAAAQELWRQLLAFGLLAMAPEGHWLTCGPRANKLNRNDHDDDDGRGRHTALDDLICLALGPRSPMSPAKLAQRRAAGFDLLGLRILASLPAGTIPTPTESGELPFTLDRVAVARRGGPGQNVEVATWIDGTGRNNTVDPGYQEAALRAADGSERFWVGPGAANGRRFTAMPPGSPIPTDHPSQQTWDQRRATREPPREPPPSWRDPRAVAARVGGAGGGSTHRSAVAIAAGLRAIADRRPRLANELRSFAADVEALGEPSSRTATTIAAGLRAIAERRPRLANELLSFAADVEALEQRR